MTDYTPDPKVTGETFQASEWTEASNELEEQENQIAAHDALIAARQPLDADLTALANATGSGYWKKSGTGWLFMSAIPKIDLDTAVQASLDAGDVASCWPVEKLSNGFATAPRVGLTGTSFPMVSGRLQLSYFTAPETATRSTLSTYAGGTPVSGTAPTLIRFGVYSVAANGDIALLGATANDTTLFTAAFGNATKTLSPAINFVKGNRYATGPLIITAGTICTMWGPGNLGAGLGSVWLPKMYGNVTGLTDLPASVAAASIPAQVSAYLFSVFT